jgi:hypothetical protein
MNAVRIGLLLNFIGAVLLGLSTQLGVAAGWFDPIVSKNWVWKFTNFLGWVLLAIGFLIQFFYINGV